MKKITVFFITVLILFSLASCDFDSAKKIISGENYVDWSKYSSEKSDKKGSIYKNNFDKLNDDQKKAYNHILFELMYAKEEFPEKIEVPVMSSDDLTTVYESIIYDNPEVMCLGKDGSIITEDGICFFKPEYTMTPKELNNKLEKMEDKADEICSQFTKNMSQFDKELIIHDYLVENCTYNSEKDDSNIAYSCMFNGYAACEGYSKATKFLLERAGIEAYTIIGDADNAQGKTESHMWNIVKIDGDYYHLDTTWDDPVKDEGIVSHIYFNLSTEDIKNDHSKFETEHECTSNLANYFVKTRSLYDSCDNEVREKMETVVIKQLEKGQNCVEFRFSSEGAYDNAADVLITRSKAYEIQKNVKEKRSDLKMSEDITYSKNDKYRIIELVF